VKNVDEKSFVFGSIFTLANRLQILGDKFDKNITIKQWLLLAGITTYTEYVPTLSEVAVLIGNSRQNVKKMALILEREGFLSFAKDSHDARILRLALTKKCTDYFIKREHTEQEFLDYLFRGLDPVLINGLYEGIIKLTGNIEEMENNYVLEEKE
jgi:DNA-binding MarR family transcriptional regulator